jgi:hypothetical protein
MEKRIKVLSAMLFYITATAAQVQVSEEPLHKPVLQNEYIRLLDVWLQPGDTTWFHIHSTPSVFLHFTSTAIASEAEGEDWVNEQSVPGKAWYRSFTPDTLIHRVTNVDTVPFHVNDIEMLSFYDTLTYRKKLYFPLLFENERVAVYSLTRKYYTTGIVKDRGPVIAELVSGDMVYYTNTLTNQKTEIKAGEYLYIDPGTSFYFSFKGKENVNMVLFEIK